MSELSPAARAFLKTVRNEWRPGEDLTAAVRAKVPGRLLARPELGTDGCGPDLGAPARSRAPVWGISVLAGLCALGFVWLRGSEPGKDVASNEIAAGLPAPSPENISTQPGPSPEPKGSPSVERFATVEALAASGSSMTPGELDPTPVSALPNLRSRASASPAPQARAEHSVAPPASDTLAEELALLRAAREDLRAGAIADATRALSAHASRYPNGALRDERMTIHVLALCESGDTRAARAVMTELERLAPGSSHLQRLATSCAAR